jgi:hypothetical protein
MQIIIFEKSKSDIIKRMQKDLADFRQHIIRVKTQYEQSRLLKEEPPGDHAILMSPNIIPVHTCVCGGKVSVHFILLYKNMVN